MANEVRQGRDEVTLEVVMEAAGPLTYGQLEGLGACAGQAHAEAMGPSCPPVTMAVQLPVVVAWLPHSS